jgi:hypothetical protein
MTPAAQTNNTFRSLPSRVRQIITARHAARRKRDFEQRKLIPDVDLQWQAVCDKLDGAWDDNQLGNLRRCGVETIYRTCKGCSDVQQFDYRCSLKWCPRCNWRISQRRAELLRLWVKRIRSPKHLVTTQRNFPVLTRRKIREHQKNLAKLRRKKVFAGVRGGCVSVEITNEGNGWHLHAHWLVDANFVSAQELAVAWGKLIGQEYGIVKVINATEKDYATEVAKYVVKGDSMMRWPREHVLEFVRAVKGIRFYFTFGELFKLSRAIRAELNQSKPPAKPCDCGCSDFVFEDEVTAVLHELRDRAKRRH